MELKKIILLSAVFAIIILITIIGIIYTNRTNRAIKNSQVDVTDKKLIEFINGQPDKIVNYKSLMEEFGLTKFESSGRLRHFLMNGLLQSMTTKNGLKTYYTISKPIDKSYELTLTDDPFMTIEDLMMIFKHYDYQVTLQEICLSTGLPIKVILEEMKYFEKEKMIQGLLLSTNGGFSYQKVYRLCEPYRSNPESYMTLDDVNFELKEIYENVRKA